ncbi:hypothetical protein AMEX_G8216 [Astyanax mexicanus]|uniref:Uncharacterized protein n=1 Tax=Astyanax mexicanus TaxID=7994 RepID=A0A8T2LX12_ASTMX|nr:hypothetical protein AMEX_G8216 [Astyanax mexicanus]
MHLITRIHATWWDVNFSILRVCRIYRPSCNICGMPYRACMPPYPTVSHLVVSRKPLTTLPSLQALQ